MVAWVALIIVAALVAGVGALTSTTSGLRALMALADRFTPIRIDAAGARGALRREFGFDRLRIELGGATVEIFDLRAQLTGYGLRPLRIDFESLSAGRIDIAVTPSERSAGPPESIASPVAVSAKRVSIGEIKLNIGTTALSARALDAEVSLGPDGYRVANGRIEWAAQPLTLEARLGGAKPFALAAQGAIETAWQTKPVQAQWRADGTLLDFTLAAAVFGGEARGTVTARIGSFDAPTLKSLHVDIDGIDLRAWRDGLPNTRLQVQAELQPDASLTRLGGSVHLVNGNAGTIDANKIPLREARADIVLTREEFRASALAIELSRGRAEGTFTAKFGAAAAWQTELRLDGVDPAAIHARARPLLLDGAVRARQAAETSFVQADVRNRGAPTVSARLDLRVTAERVDIQRADLALGGGLATSTGTLGLTGEKRVRVKGTIDRFDPGLLVKGVDARISGDFDAEAQLAPQPSAAVRFELKDSRAFGRPLTGRGRVQLDAAQHLDVDVQLAVRSAHISAQGGLGAAGRSLGIALDAPALNELVPQVHGALKADATVSGAWRAPAVEARVVANDLRYGDHAVQQAQVSASYSGGADGRLSVQAGATNHALRDKPALSLRTAALAVEGLLSAHAITLRATTANARDVALAAHGGWSNRAWRGLLREANIGAPLDLRLLAPSPVSVGADGIELGPAQLALAGARFDEIYFASDGAGVRTRGSFSGLRPHALVAREAAGDGAGVGGRAPLDWLTLRGRWQLQLGAQADGSVLVERSGGDLYAGTTAETALRLRELWLEANLKANRLDARAVMAGDRGGTVNAQMSAAVERAGEAGWRLAQQRPWQIDANADVPSLALAHALLGERVRLDGHLAAQVNIDGTPSESRARGTLKGEALRVAWVEQGMRLENGTLRLRLEGDVVLLDELHFAGPPRVRPKEMRAASKVDFTQEGSVSATGELRVRDLEGVIRVTAQRLPLLQRPDRWVIASGSAKVETSLKRVQVNGDIAAVAGYVEAAPAGLPSLPSDVVVARSRGEPAQRAPQFALGFDVGIDLGQAFYVSGAGVKARAEGLVRLRSAGRGAVTASGAIEAKDGRFDGFGQRLAIRRGRVNFQGPPENPSLDVLAIREGLPVEVGVTITRTVNNPLVRLYSDPSMSDPEIMSWLVLGHAGDQSRADNLALLQTATGLLSGNEQGISGRFAQSLGIDDISLRSGQFRSAGSLLPQSSVAGDLRADRSSTPTATTEILKVGKRVNEAITISYEQALSGTESVVQLSYRLSQRLSLVARAGTVNALDLVYSIAFD